MRLTLNPFFIKTGPSFLRLYRPVEKAMINMPPLTARGNRPLQMTFEDQLKALIFFHLEEHTSAQHLLQVLHEDAFARQFIAPENGIQKSSFSEAINTRSLEQLTHIYQNLQAEALGILPKEHANLEDLIAIDGSLIDACLSMQWAGLITYLLLAIYCREQHNEKVSIRRVRELRIKIQNEMSSAAIELPVTESDNMIFSPHQSYASS